MQMYKCNRLEIGQHILIPQARHIPQYVTTCKLIPILKGSQNIHTHTVFTPFSDSAYVQNPNTQQVYQFTCNDSRRCNTLSPTQGMYHTTTCIPHNNNCNITGYEIKSHEIWKDIHKIPPNKLLTCRF